MNRTQILGVGLTTVLLSSCAADNSRSTGGGSVQTGDFAGLYVAAGGTSIARIELDGRKVDQVEIGGEPTRIARVKDRVYVTLRSERSVAILQERDGRLEDAGRIPTGAEPYGIVATDSRIYVAASVGGFVAEYDATSLEALRSWSIPGEPRWLTMHPSKRALYVGSVYGGTLTHINLESGVARPVAIPQIASFNFQDGTPLTLTPRITGDVVASPDGKNIWLPMLYVDNKSTIPDVSEDETDPCNPTDGAPPPSDPSKPEPVGGSGSSGGAMVPPGGGRGGGLGCGGGYNNQKFNPTVDKVPVDPITGEPTPEVIAEAINIVSGAQIEDSAGNPINFESISGYPATLAVSEDSKMVFAAIEGAEAVVVIMADLPEQFGEQPPMGARVPTSDAAFPGDPRGGQGFSFRNTVSIKTGAAPRGIAVVDSRLYVHSYFDQKIEDIAVDDVQDWFDFQLGNVTKTLEVDVGPNGSPRQLRTRNALQVANEVIAADVDAGRRLFIASNNPLMAQVGAGVSCGTCHFDTRTDGLTWTFERGLRQTPNLSVNMQTAMPVGWAGNVANVADEGFSTSQRLMGGQQLTREHADSLQAFVFAAREIDSPNKHLQTSAEVMRGAEVFVNVGCVTCHNGTSYTDNKTYPMLGLEVVKTRPLSGIAASAPYFHDGTAATLKDVVRRAARGEMGPTFDISPADEDALVEYLKSL